MKNIPALTGFRFVAAILVFFSHYPMARFAAPLYPFAEHGYAGVTLFFVLSGFILCINYFDRLKNDFSWSHIERFFVARFARIYPLYFISIIYEWAASNGVQNPIPQLFAIQAWYADTGTSMAINGPTWSLSVELFLYLTFPPLLYFFLKIRLEKSSGRLVTAGLSLVLILFAAAFYFVHTGRSVLPWSDLASAHRWLYRNPAVRIFDFGIGIIAGIWYLKRFPLISPHPLIWSAITYTSCLTTLALFFYPPHLYSAISWDVSIAVPGIFLILGLSANSTTLISKLLARPGICRPRRTILCVLSVPRSHAQNVSWGRPGRST